MAHLTGLVDVGTTIAKEDNSRLGVPQRMSKINNTEVPLSSLGSTDVKSTPLCQPITPRPSCVAPSRHQAPSGFVATLRIFTASVELYFESRVHKGPIFATRFSRGGKWLATASLDNTVCLWDVEKKQRRMQYKHRGICLDLDWLDEELFASCSADKVIHILSVNHAEPVAVLMGHDGEVNQIKANPSGTRIVLCSDDMTSRIWEMRRVKQSPESDRITISGEMTVLEGHRNWVTGVSWSPLKMSGDRELVAIASFDSTARIGRSLMASGAAVEAAGVTVLGFFAPLGLSTPGIHK